MKTSSTTPTCAQSFWSSLQVPFKVGAQCGVCRAAGLS